MGIAAPSQIPVHREEIWRSVSSSAESRADSDGAAFDGISSNSVARAVSPAVLESIDVVPASPTVPLAAGTFKFTAMGTFSDTSTQGLCSFPYSA